MTSPAKAESLDRLVLVSAGIPTVIVGVVASLIGLAVSGGRGLVGGLLGTAIVVIFFTAGQLALGAVIRNNPQLALTVALMVYLIKIGVLLVLLIVLQGVTFFDPKVFGLTIVTCTVVWTVAEVWVYGRTKVLYVDPSGPSSGGRQ